MTLIIILDKLSNINTNTRSTTPNDDSITINRRAPLADRLRVCGQTIGVCI